MNETAFPLCWPSGWKRTSYRERSRFKVSGARPRDELFRELDRLGANNIILSTNIKLRLDGIPYSNLAQPLDPGVAVYFQHKKKPMVFACDAWRSVEENIWSICKTIEAIRGIERWGASDMLERAFSGFQSLPAPLVIETWWSVLGVKATASAQECREARTRLARKHHPDVGGSAPMMAKINRAFDEALENR